MLTKKFINKIFPFKVFPAPNVFFTPTDFTKRLGRWCTDIDDKKINNRADWANEDHCGACGTPWENSKKINDQTNDHKK
jgi:hypothetical protein